ncbi:hypothetical protein ABPG72_002233 [Tetrahymena utriculariae]
MQDFQQGQEESHELKQAIKFKQENHRVKIRREKLNRQLNFTRLKFANKNDPDFNQNQNEDIKSLSQNEQLVAQKLQQLQIHFNLREFDQCLQVVTFFSQYTIFNSSEEILKESIQILNETDFPLYLIAFISQEIAVSYPQLFKKSLKIMQNIPYVWDQQLISKLVEYRVLDNLIEILKYQQDEIVINNALFTLASFSCTDQNCVQNKLIQLKAYSVFQSFQKFDVFRTGLIYLYECTFGNMVGLTVEDFSEEDQESFKFIIQYLMGELKKSCNEDDEDITQQVLWALSGMTKIEALIEFNEISEYVLLLDILENNHKELAIIPALCIVNYLSYNSDRNIEEFISFDYISVLKKYSDHQNYKARIHTMYTFINMAACSSQNIKDVLLEKNLVAKFLVMMQEDKPKIRNQCALFFAYLLDNSNENFIRRAIQDYYFMNIAKQIFEQINDVDNIFSLLKTFEYILDCVQSQDIMVFVLQQIQYYKINEYIEELTQQCYEHVTDKALLVHEKLEELISQYDLN